mgnify:CR=1 FL=1
MGARGSILRASFGSRVVTEIATFASRRAAMARSVAGMKASAADWKTATRTRPLTRVTAPHIFWMR